MFLLGFEGLILANLAGLAAAKISSDVVVEETQRNAARPTPQRGGQPYYAAQRNTYGPAEVRLDQQANGCFYARCLIDDQPAMMMIDTGSTGVVIGHRLARRLGFDLASGRYDLPVRTGGGVVYACRFTLPELNCEGLIGRNLDAIVHEREMASEQACDGLVGQSFLRHIVIEQHGNVMILRPRG
jgi:clan AA aspartic protease (TIGR02281 family)